MDTKKKYRIVKETPEGGWGWLIVIGLSLPLSCSYAMHSLFGLMFKDFLAELGAGTTAVTIIHSVFSISISCSSLLAISLQKKFPLRAVGLFGASLYCLGCFFTIFATSVEFLIVSYGIFQGVGFGIMLPVCFSFFNKYFVKRRVLAMSVSKILQSFIKMATPMSIHFLMETYGFRGMLAILAAINFHAIFGMIVMHPVEWHSKEIKVPIDESESLMFSNENEQNREKIAPESESSDKKEDASNVADSDECPKNGKWQKVVDFLDLTLLKDLSYVNIVIGLTIGIYSEGAFLLLLPLYLLDEGISKEKTAEIMSAAPAAELIARILMGIISLRIYIKARRVYLAGVIAVILSRFAFMSTLSFAGLIATSSAMGFFGTFMSLNVVIAFAEHLPPDRFASGYGLFLFLCGNLNFLLSPLVGIVRDATNSYLISFSVVTLVLSLCPILWICEYLWLRYRPRKQTDYEFNEKISDVF